MSVETDRVEAFWLNRMAKPLPVLELPTDVQRPPVYEHRRDVMGLPLSDQLTHQINILCKKLQTDMKCVMMTAYFVWLHRMTHSEDIYIGTPLGRLPEEEEKSGREFLPVRIFLEGLDRFDELVKEVASRCEEAASHASYPFAHLLANVFTERDESSPVAYSACFQWIDGEEGQAEYPAEISWNIHYHQGRLSLHVGYHPLLFRSHTMRRYAEIYCRILSAMTEDPQQSFRKVDILTNEDQALYRQLNQTAHPFPAESTIPRMFQEAAEKFPANRALSMNDVSLTYQELHETTNQIAHMLADHGVQKGDYVAIFMNRSVETVISILAILKAGGVYIPIDPEYPEDRIRYMLEDSQASYLVTTTAHAGKAQELGRERDVRVLLVDQPVGEYPRTNVAVEIDPTDLAYIIYTSGSTGRPKGTLLAHQGVVNLSTWMRDYFQISETDVVFGFASFSFDASVFELFSALFWGARFHLLSAADRLSFESFADAVEREKGTFVTLPTAFFKQLAEHLQEEEIAKLATMKRIAVAGEALTGEIVRKWQRRLGQRVQIINAYGPTECTVCSSAYKIEASIPDHQAHIPIGTPIYNTEFYVVSPSGQLCPAQVPGELYIGSVGMARGYLHQPEKTRDFFIPHPFTDVPGRRLYKSGDIVRLLRNGTIEYVGRKDDQVKIRGFRIEIGEIEDTILRHADIQEGVVIVRKEEGESRLIAYYTVKAEREVTQGQLRAFLAEQLPDYMIPELMIRLEEMPLTPNNKVDRKALAARQDRMIAETEYVAPRTEEERLLAEAWQEVLGYERIGIHDDFFHLGGHSLKILHALALVKPHFPFLRIQDFFQYRTIGQMARYLADCKRQERGKQGESGDSGRTDEIRDLHESQPRSVQQMFDVRAVQPQMVFLTGATGYLGSHLLYELLKQPELHVYCMVRPSGDIQKRLEEKLRFYFGEEGAKRAAGRITAIPGDLTRPMLGMAEDDIRLLLDKVDTMIHAAADVRHFGEADHFYQVNVAGTRELLDLARQAKGIRFHYVSTISVPEELALAGQWEHYLAHGDFDYACTLENVYANSKLQAERLVREAIQEGIPATIYRAGNLVGHSKTGRFQENIDSNAFYRMMKGMLLLEKVPHAHMWVDLTPVDFASEALVALARQQETIGRIFHLVNPRQILFTEFVAHLRELGYPIELMEPAAYEAMLFSPEQKIEGEVLQLAMAQLEGDGVKDSPYRFGCRETAHFLEPLAVRCPAPDRELIATLLEYARNIGYVPNPLKAESIGRAK